MRSRAVSASPEATVADDRSTEAVAYDIKKSRKRFQQKLAALQQTLAKKRHDRSVSSGASITDDGGSAVGDHGRPLVVHEANTLRTVSASHSESAADGNGWYRLSPSPATSVFHSAPRDGASVPTRATSVPRSAGAAARTTNYLATRQPSVETTFSAECSPPPLGRVNPRALMEEDEAGFLETGFMTDPRRTRSRSMNNHNNAAIAAVEHSDGSFDRAGSMEMHDHLARARSNSPPVQRIDAASQWVQPAAPQAHEALDHNVVAHQPQPARATSYGGGTVMRMADFPFPDAPPRMSPPQGPHRRLASVDGRSLERTSLATRLVAPCSVERQRSSSASRSYESEIHGNAHHASEPRNVSRDAARPHDAQHNHAASTARGTRPTSVVPPTSAVFRLRPATAGALEEESQRLAASVRRQHEIREAHAHQQSAKATQRLAARRLEAETRHQQRLAGRKQQKPQPKKNTMGLVDARRFHGGRRSQSAHATQASISPRHSIYQTVLDEGVHVADDQADFGSQRRRSRSTSWTSRGQHSSISPARSASSPCQRVDDARTGVRRQRDDADKIIGRAGRGETPHHPTRRSASAASSADRMAEMYASRAEGSRTVATERRGTPVVRPRPSMPLSTRGGGTRRLTAPRASHNDDTDTEVVVAAQDEAPARGTTVVRASAGCHSHIIPPSESPEHCRLYLDPAPASSVPRAASTPRERSASRHSVVVTSYLSPQRKDDSRAALRTLQGGGHAASPPLYLSPESLRVHNHLLVGRRKSRSADNGTIDAQQQSSGDGASIDTVRGIDATRRGAPSVRDCIGRPEALGITARDVNVHPGTVSWPPPVGCTQAKHNKPRFSLRDLYGEPAGDGRRQQQMDPPRSDMGSAQPTRDIWPRVAPTLSATPPQIKSRGAAPPGGTAEADEMMQRIAAMRALMAGM